MGCSPSKIEGQGTKRLRAAILIQKWYRRYIANLEIRRRCTWNIFQSIEYAGELDQLKLLNFFNSVLLGMSNDGGGQAPLIRAFSVNTAATAYEQKVASANDDLFLSYAEEVIVENNYRGVHLTFPLTLNQLHGLVQAFRSKLALHAKYTIQLLLEVRRILKTQSNIRHASTSISKQITICGDLHGKLSDLYMVFQKNGLPAVNNPYIFNGDFVDRGHFSTEVALVLFSCFLMNPNEVYINRGNHEDHAMNVRYGFIKELQHKYKQHSKKVIHLFKDVFSWLPLATIVDDQVFVSHGGISDTTDLQILAEVDRHRYKSALQPPGGTTDLSTLSQEDLIQWKQVLDLLWSDPKMSDGCQPNTFRGGGVYFGPDVTAQFLQRYKFKLLIRSHECKPDGYEFTHNGQVLTVFSASNYYEAGSNLGAFVRLQTPDLQCRFVQYLSSYKPAFRKISFTQRINAVEKSALLDLKERMLASKSELLQECKKFDTNNTGTISGSDWCFVMESVLEMELPWRTLKSKLVRTDECGNVFYETSLEKLEIKHRYSGNGPSITEQLYKHKNSLATIFRLIDADNSGHISMHEFEDALNILTKQLNIKLEEKDIRDIAASLDINKDGYIDFNEFLEAFRIVDNTDRNKPVLIETPSDNTDRNKPVLIETPSDNTDRNKPVLIQTPSDNTDRNKPVLIQTPSDNTDRNKPVLIETPSDNTDRNKPVLIQTPSDNTDRNKPVLIETPSDNTDGNKPVLIQTPSDNTGRNKPVLIQTPSDNTDRNKPVLIQTPSDNTDRNKPVLIQTPSDNTEVTLEAEATRDFIVLTESENVDLGISTT